MFVRWLGAFGSSNSLEDSLIYELSLTNHEVACEVIKGRTSKISHAKIGLQVYQQSIVKKFNGDCWSVKQKTSCDGDILINGKENWDNLAKKELRKTRNPKKAESKHGEAWALTPCYKSIQVKSLRKVSESVLTTVFDIAEKYSLPVYEFETGRKLN